MDFEKYKMPAGSYPDRLRKPQRPGGTASAQDHRDYADGFDIYTQGLEAFDRKLLEYKLKESDLILQFWKDAFKEIEIDFHHPKADLLRTMAWEYGHSSGFSEVFSWLQDLAKLLG